MLSVKPWQPLAVLQYCAAVIFCICLGGLLSIVLQQLHISGFKEAYDFGNLLLGTLSFQGVACLLAPVFLWWHKVSWHDALGLRDPRLKRVLLLALLVFVIALPTVLLLQRASVFTLTKLGHPPDDQAAVQIMNNAKSWWVRGYMAGVTIFLAPLAEEFFFRGLLYPCAKQFGSSPFLAACISFMAALRMVFPLHHAFETMFPVRHIYGMNWFFAISVCVLFGIGLFYPLLRRLKPASLSVICVSLLFALIHGNTAILLPLFVLALILTWLYEMTDNLLAPIAVHALFNATNLAVMVLIHLHILPAPK